MLLRKLLYIFVYLFLKVLNISCEDGSTLAFAIDDTRSMWNDIHQVRKEATEIMNIVLQEKSSEIKDFVLVTINDPDVILRTKTSSASTFQAYLNRIRVHNFGNDDCAELSLTGIEKALLASRPGSYIYVFTDASAKDYHKVDQIRSLSQKKQSQVVFVLTGDCEGQSDRKYTVYHEIAAASGGQVFRVNKNQVESVLQTIKELLKGKNPAIKWTMVPKTKSYVPVPFTIDEMADYALVSTSGSNVYLKISTTNDFTVPEPKTEKIMWNDNGKVVKLVDPKPGTYYAWVKGDSAVSVVVYARTDFTFEHGFSALEPKSMKDTSKQPIAGEKQHLSINVTDPENSVDIKSVQILDMDNIGHVIMELPLKKTDDNFYITDTFVSPTQMFKIGVKGETKKTRKPITRISKTAVEPQIPIVVIPETIPDVKISEGVQLIVNYGADASLTCKVTAHPAPKIEWFTSAGVSLPSESSLVEETSYISYLKLKNIKQNGTYVCKAINKKGTRDSSVKVGLRPVFDLISIPATTTTTKYGEDIKIPCNIKSYLPIKVRWFRSGIELSNSGEHSISADGSELTLKSVDLGMQGEYTCEASLNSDPTVKEIHPTDVKLTGLAPPVIEPTNKKIHVMKSDNIELNCKTATGYPKPHVQWFKRSGDHFNPLPQTGEVLRVPKALFTHAGTYKCFAMNVVGNDSAEFEVTMSSLPEITIAETKRIFPYGSSVEFTCKVESQPPPTIVWTNEKGSVLENKVVHTSEYEYENKLILLKVKKNAVYSCVASNKIGTTTDHVNITVPSPFEIKEHIDGETEADYGTEQTLRCDIKSSQPMKIQWYRQTSGVKSSSLVLPSKKYTLENNGSELKIKFMDSNMVGKYTCEASLLSDPEEKVSFNTKVKVVGLNVKISEGAQLIVNYGADASLTCKVTAHPAPKIEWFTSAGVSLPSETSFVEESSYISYVKLNSIKQNETYVCKAVNKKGIKDSSTQIGVRPVFNTVAIPANTTTAKYGEDVKISCNIKSYLPSKIRWFHLGKELSNTGMHSISADGSELILKSMDLEMQGEYTCEASLNSDPNVKEIHQTNVKIAGLAPPVIEPTNKKIRVMKRDKIELNCKTATGYPKPHVQWLKRSGDHFNPLPQTGEVLRVPKALFTHAGTYKCVAMNVIGNDSAEFEVTMSSLPEITIAETKRIFPYGSSVEFTCKVESQPPPTIVWTNEKGSILENKVAQTSEYEFTNKLKLQNVKKNAVYSCVASNKIGSTTDHVNITVPSPFEIKEHIDGETKANYGTEQTLHCDIKSSQPIKIQWYRQTSGVKSSRALVLPSSKYTLENNGSELKIKFMDLDMVGKYTCEASLLSDPEEKISFNTDVKVAGLTGPEITHSTTVLNGKNFTAICRIKGVPKPTISWQFKPKGSKDFIAIPGSEEELNIPELKLKHSGVYKCMAKNILSETQRELDVIVEEPPIITNDETTYYGVEGDLIMKIPCNVTGFPEPTIVWKNEGKNIEKDSKHEIKGSVLYIKNPLKSDPKAYICEAKNKLGTATKKFETEVVGNFQNDENFYGDTHNIYAEQGKPVTIKCNITNPETKSVRWYRNGQKTDQTGSTYTIKQAYVSDDGNYTCRVNTDEGSKSENYLLDVGYAPTFDNNNPSTTNIVWKEDDEILDCRANAKPEVKYEWLYDGKIVESLNDIPQKSVTDWKEYTCRASNVHGSIQRTFKVSTPGCYLTKNMGTQNKPLMSDASKLTWPISMSNSDILLKENEEIKLSCPSDKKSSNAFQMIPSKKEIIAKCKTEDKFIVDGKTYKYSDLQCKEKVEPSIINKHEQCYGPNSEMIRVGFSVNGFMDAYKICYDRSLNVPLYGAAPISLSRIGNGAKPSEFKWSPATGLADGKPTGGYTTCKTSGKCCYAKGQLVNVNEMVFGPAQVAIFKENLNSVAVWNPCENSSRTSWETFEKEMLDMSLMYDTWSSWTGASDYATKNGGLVPRYLWKFMNFEGDSSVMVYVNDESPVPGDIRCTKPCESMMESSDKYLYCCSPEEFSKAFGLSTDKFKST